MSEKNDLVVIEKANALAVFSNKEQLDPLIEAIEKEARSLVCNVNTSKGRDAIRSMAYKVTQSKTYIDNAGKELVTELKALPKKIDESRRLMRERLDALRDEVRRPLTEWEDEQERQKAEEEARLKAEEERLARERVEREKQEAIENERKKAQEEANRLKREFEAKEAARVEEENRKALEEKRRQDDIEHRRRVNRQSVEELLRFGIPLNYAKKCVEAIAKSSITYIKINY